MTLVLVVDDVPALGEQYAYDLRRLAGYEVQVVTDGRQALELLGGEAVDCVVLDLDGALRIETAPGAGTRAIVELPAAGHVPETG